VVAERPQFFLQTIVQFLVPFFAGGTRQPGRDPFGVAAVPSIFGGLNLLAGGFLGRIQNAKEAGTSSAMLDVRPAAFVDSRHVKTVARLDEGDLVLRQRIPSWR